MPNFWGVFGVNSYCCVFTRKISSTVRTPSKLPTDHKGKPPRTFFLKGVTLEKRCYERSRRSRALLRVTNRVSPMLRSSIVEWNAKKNGYVLRAKRAERTGRNPPSVRAILLSNIQVLSLPNARRFEES